MISVGQRLEELIEIVSKLRGPDGCPWDKEQTSKSLLPFLIEEIYEVIESVDDDDWETTKEELGDVLLHVVFQASIAKDKNRFDLNDSIKIVNEKLIRRHPHVFKNNKAGSVFKAQQNWEEAKHKEKKRESRLDGVPKNLPELIRAQRLQQKASYAGFDWDQVEQVWNKVYEEIEELKQAQLENNKKEIQNEIGDVLFSIINLARFFDISADEALRLTNKKFINRFRYIENQLQREGEKFEKTELNELDKYWNEAKSKE